jgi:glycosyltransferase involved in cell wall biosynthesis
MKIMIIINGIYPETIGGIQKIGSELAPLLAGKHEVVVYTDPVNKGPTNEIKNNFTIKRIKSSDNFRIKYPLGTRLINTLRQLKLEKEKPEVILAMSLTRGFISYVANRIYGIPYVVYVLGSDWNVARDKRIGGKLSRFALERCDTLITQTRIVKDDILNRFPGTRIEVVPNGITLPQKRAHGDKIVFLGRLNKVKGIEFLIDAVRDIKDCPELVISGSGPEEAKLRAMSEGLNVRITGRIAAVEDLYRQGKFFVLPSLSEGLPQVILEAMSYGLPVISTRVGGIPDVIEHGKTGFLVEPGNSEELRKHIEILLSDEAICERMSERCLTEVKKYSWDKIVARIEDVLQAASTRNAR